jgi:hypothetical protein
MHRLETSIEISAPVERVWSLLVDFSAYPRWNPFVRSIEGTASAGESLRVVIQSPGSGGMRFRPEVLACVPNRELRWKGRLWMAGFFDGEHYFKIEPRSEGVLFTQGEVFSGLLVPLFRRSLDGATRRGFILMNEALKREAENGQGLHR